MENQKPRARTWLLCLLALVVVIAAVLWRPITDAARSLATSKKLKHSSLAIYSQQLPAELRPFLMVLSPDPEVAKPAESTIEANWDNSHAVLLLEVARIGGSLEAQSRIHNLLVRTTGQPAEWSSDDWWRWVWSEKPGTPPNYAQFKGVLYSSIDPRFSEYFDDDPKATIRLDEIRWGGVKRDGIPPLESPEKIDAADADYLEDDNVIFGVEFNGEAVAYPKRILAWHEMVKDTVGGESINGAYCTLCGSMIVYNTKVDGVHHDLGTSGFLYRSNKLMYDRATQSMWSTIRGEPVVGPLVDQGIQLQLLDVVTSTWGEWRRRHPETLVLSLNTNHNRDYSEGAAYRDYFGTDKLMFTVPQIDERLKNKDEVLALRSIDDPEDQLAIAADFLKENPVYQTKVGSVDMLVLTDTSGANRVYELGDHKFSELKGDDTVKDDAGAVWQITEAALVNDEAGKKLLRLPAHRAFWFGWYSAFPKTRLVQ